MVFFIEGRVFRIVWSLWRTFRLVWEATSSEASLESVLLILDTLPWVGLLSEDEVEDEEHGEDVAHRHKRGEAGHQFCADGHRAGVKAK